MSTITPNTPEYRLTSKNPDHYPPAMRAVFTFISFIKWRFSLAPTGAFRWLSETENTPDQKGSEIFIAHAVPLKGETVGMRPAITVSRSTVAFQGVGIGDLAFHDMATGAKAYQDLIPTTVVINVLSRIPFVADRLAHFVQEEIFTMREEIIRTEPCILYTGAKATLPPPQPAPPLMITGADHEWSVAQILIPTFLQHTTSKLPLNKPSVREFRSSVRSR
jgi:hypothetical protein